MLPLDDKTKLQAKSCPEVVDGLVAEAKRLKRQADLKWVYRLSHGPLLNALVVWYLRQPPAQREEIAREGLEALGELVNKPIDISANTITGAIS